MEGYDELIARVTAQPARQAFEALHAEAQQSGFNIGYKRSGHVPSVDLRWDGSHMFSWIPNRKHLLFYIRKPALATDATLAECAFANHPADASRNAAGEVTIRIADPTAAGVLTDWLFSVFGKTQSRRGGARWPQLTLCSDEHVITDAFRAWRDTLAQEAEQFGTRDYWLPKQGIAFVEQPDLNLSFATNPGGQETAVQVNLPQTAGGKNPLSAIGVAADGTRYVLRQAWLQPTDTFAEDIRNEVFSERTGLAPVQVIVADRKSQRIWHVVACLDGVSAEEIRDETARFVGRCWSARLWDRDAKADRDRLAELFGTDERGGQNGYMVPAHERLLRRRHGDVWLALNAVLASNGIHMSKPRHLAGYEVDAVILAPSGPLLVEIKTGTSAADIYAGIGQLALYPQMLPRLREMPRILLLPGRPQPALMDAVGNCGVELHSYAFGREGDTTFSAEFLRRCGCMV